MLQFSAVTFVIFCYLSVIGGLQSSIHENVAASAIKGPASLSDHISAPIAFGGVMNHWEMRVMSNDTDARRAVKFAVRYAKRKTPDIFPSRADIKFTHQVKNVQKMKVVYTANDKSPAMFSAMDPVLNKPVNVPIIWGMWYTFQIHVNSPDKLFTIIHHFSLFEYIDEIMYIVEHSYHCVIHSHRDNIDDIKFGRTLCTSALQMGSDSCKNCDKIKQANGTNSDDQSETSTDTKDNLDQSNTSKQKKDTGRGSPKSHFSFLSFNVWNTNVQGEFQNMDLRYIQRIQHIAKVINDTRPDVIAFQEVRFEDAKGGSFGPNQMSHLSKLLPDYQYVFQPGQVQTTRLPDLVIEGVAIFSRHPIVNREHLLLYRNPEDRSDGHQRVLLHAEVDLPGVGTVHFLTTHLSLSHKARLHSVQEIWAYVQRLHGAVFLAGDFNAEAHNEEVRFLAGKYKLSGQKTSGFQDIWELHHGPDNKGFTFNTLQEELSKRIDLIFMKDVPGLSVTDVKITDDKTRGKEAASDHLGLLGTFAMKQTS